MLAAAVGALAGGAAATAVWLLVCEELECVGWWAVFVVGAVLGAPIAFTIVLDAQRWRARRRDDLTGGAKR